MSVEERSVVLLIKQFYASLDFASAIEKFQEARSNRVRIPLELLAT